MSRGHAIAMGLLKTASGVAEAGERLAKGLKTVVRGSAELGGGVARGLGVHENVGKALGVAGLAGGTYVAGRKVKNKIDQARYDAGLY